MKPSRREALKAAGMAAAGTLLPMPTFGLEGAADSSRAEASRSAWSSQLGSSFWVRPRNAPAIELRLESVGDLPSAEAAGVAGHERSFSLLFEGPLRPRLRQGTYELSGFGSRPLALFLVPVDRARTEQRYEAIFNNPFN